MPTTPATPVIDKATAAATIDVLPFGSVDRSRPCRGSRPSPAVRTGRCSTMAQQRCGYTDTVGTRREDLLCHAHALLFASLFGLPLDLPQPADPAPADTPKMAIFWG